MADDRALLAKASARTNEVGPDAACHAMAGPTWSDDRATRAARKKHAPRVTASPTPFSQRLCPASARKDFYPLRCPANTAITCKG